MAQATSEVPYHEAYLRQSADRYRLAWTLRCDGMMYRDLAVVLGISDGRAQQIVVRAEKRMLRALASRKLVLDPIAEGVWHEFTPEGRVKSRFIPHVTDPWPGVAR